MNLFKRLFNNKKKDITSRSTQENMVRMASIGIAPDKIMQYQENIKKIEAFDRN